MPGYNTHITWSSVAGVGLGLVARTVYNVSLPQAAFGGVLCALGGVLPDVDSDSSRAFQRCMSTVSGAFSLLLANRLSFFDIADEGVVMISAFAYFFIFYAIGGFVKKATAHRGMCHSIPFGVIAAEVIFILSAGSTQLRLFKAACIFFGVMIHLTLDELASVNLIRESSPSRKSNSYYSNSYGSNRSGYQKQNSSSSGGMRIKKSFGTGLKLIDFNHMGTTIAFYVVAAILGQTAMHVQETLDNLGDTNSNAMRGVAAVDRVRAAYPMQYDLSVVKWVAENDLVLAPSSEDNKKWLELQDVLTISNKPPEGAAADAETGAVSLLDVVNWDSVNEPNPENRESTSSTPARRHRRPRPDFERNRSSISSR